MPVGGNGIHPEDSLPVPRFKDPDPTVRRADFGFCPHPDGHGEFTENITQSESKQLILSPEPEDKESVKNKMQPLEGKTEAKESVLNKQGMIWDFFDADINLVIGVSQHL